MKKYGSVAPPNVPLENFNLPTAIFSGSLDKMADPADVAWLEEQIKDHIVFQGEYELGHLSFAMAKDMSYFTGDVVTQMSLYATNDFITKEELLQ